MKNFVLKSVFLIMFLAFLGCSSDSSDSTEKLPPKCTPIVCKNGGISDFDCGCICPAGYTGTDCSIQKTPSKIIISKIRVTKFPNRKPNGDYWDILPNSDADIYIHFVKGDVVLYNSGKYENAFSDGNNYYDFIPTTPIQITDLNTPYILSLFDYDSTSVNDDNLGFTSFYIYSSTTGFPSTAILGKTTDAIRYELTLSYIW